MLSTPLWATTFIVPDDKELVEKSAAIVQGVVIESSSRTNGNGRIETVYDVRVQRVLKGDVRETVIQVASLGGNVGRRWLVVPGAAHFEKGDKVLLFLTKHRGAWTPTDMTLGKFRFITSSGGQSLLLRDEEDIVGFDKQMRTHVERIRREADFLAFVEDTVRGRRVEANYFVSPKETVALKSDKALFGVAPHAFASHTYAMKSGTMPFRWAHVEGVFADYYDVATVPFMTASTARPFFQSTQGLATGLGDGGVGMLQSSVNGWINDCGSYVNVPYGGTNTLFANAGSLDVPADPEDQISTVIWNDPQGDIVGNWTGSGTVATCFIGGGDRHTFDGRVAVLEDSSTGWISISDADVVVQNGLTGTESFVDTALMHEIGHGIGLRHSNQNSTGGACSDDCSTGTAIMNSSVVEAAGFTPQTWDVNAIRALYPASCCTAPSITSQPSPVSIFTGQNAQMSVGATGTATLTFQWYAGLSGNTSSPVGGATGSSLSVSLTSTTSYWVRVTNGCGTADSNTVTVTVNANTPSVATTLYLVTPCRVVDTRNANGPSGGPALVPGGVRNLLVAGVCGIPTGAVAISLNLAVIDPVSNGYMTLYPGPAGSALPLAATINYKSGRVLANNAIVRVGSDVLNVFNSGPGSVHYVIDVNGYYK